MTTIKHTLCDTHNINLRRICTYKKKPDSCAFFKNCNFSSEDKTVSKTKSFFSARQRYLSSVATCAAFKIAVGEFQSPKVS